MSEDLFSEDERWILREYKQEQHNPLRREFDAMLNAMSARDMTVLHGHGIPAPQLFGESLVGAANIETGRNDFWTPTDSGPRAIIIPAMENGCIIDLIAFRPSQPDTWYARVGNCWALGMDEIADARSALDQSHSIFLHATPLDWLRAGGRGVCVIDWTDDARLTLRDLRAIDVASPKFARALRLELSRPPRIPEIKTGRMRRDAA